MKKTIIRSFSILLALAMAFGFVPIFRTNVRAVTANQQNIADRADFFFNTTWVCQKDVNAWRDEFVFKTGETYHLPYGQPVNSGKFIGYGVELEDFLMAAADADSVFYSTQSEFNGWTSVYYATDCAAFVAMCWGTVRQDCSTLPYYSTYKGAPTLSNIYNVLQLGDALDSTSVGHVVLVSDLIYDNNGELIQIEITEQTPPQLKRTYFTPKELAAKYGAEFGIYRYEGSVPAVPEWGYTTECTNYASHCKIEITGEAPIMSLPCESTVDPESVQLGTVIPGEGYIATRLYDNTKNELWYRIALESDEVGYITADSAQFREFLLNDIGLSDASFPNAHVRGKTFSLVGNLYSRYNQLVTAYSYIYQGFGVNGSPVTGGSGYATGNAYTLKSSTIDYNSSFGNLSLGNHTMTIGVTYKNHYVENGSVVEKSGTLELAQEYFMVVSSSVNQNSHNHSYSQTVLSEGSCTEPGLTVFACSGCGKVYKQHDEANGHFFGDWETTAATCTQDGKEIRTCSLCGYIETRILEASGHNYSSEILEGNCQEQPRTIFTCVTCGDSYTVYPEEIMSDWQETLPKDIDPDLVETKTQYRYSDMEESIFAEKELEGHTYLGDTWETVNTESLDYVKQWPSGFHTGSALYNQYNKAPVASSENENTKVFIDSDRVTGYVYYHWCYDNSYFSQSIQTGQYNTFHAYYSTTNPNTYRVDTSDMSYCTAHDTCDNTDWFFVVEVNTQTSTTQQKMYRQGKWQDYSEWSDIPAQASDARRIETRTMYRYPELNVTSHQYEITTIDPTCTEDGMIIYTCSACGDHYQEDLPALGHNYVSSTVDATCTEAGYTVYTCTTCGDSYQNEAPAPGHNYESVTVEATCTTEGSITNTCTTCGDINIQVFPATGHDYQAVISAPTCTEIGYTTYTCHCGDTYTGDDVDALGHNYECITVDSTCTTDGSVTGTCTTCGDIKVQIIPADGHNYKAVVTAPTCTESGYTTYTCACGDSYVGDATPALEHNYQLVTVDPTCTTEGRLDVICSNCGDTKTGVIPATGHSYANGYCTVCGEEDPGNITPAIKPTISLKGPTLEFKDMVCINVFYTADNIQDVVEMGMITYKSEVSEWNVETADCVIPGATYVESSQRYYSSSQGIHAKYLADTVYLAIYAKLTDGTYTYSKLVHYSPLTYANNQLNKSTNTKLKQLVVAMLNYGAEAQLYFGHNVDSLANASLSSNQMALPDAYRSDMVHAVPVATVQKQGIFANNKGFSGRSPAISFEGAFCINYFFTPAYMPVDGITLYYWTEADFGTAEVLTVDNASGYLKMDGTGVGQYRGDIAGISAKNLSEAIYVSAVYSDGNTNWTSGVLGYSIGTYCSSQAAKGGNVADLAMATAVYGYHAKQYFG